jgi:hypothetical protein
LPRRGGSGIQVRNSSDVVGLLRELEIYRASNSYAPLVVISLAPSGNVVYYGDIYGTIVALNVANFATTAPTSFPTGTPSTAPTSEPTKTHVPTAAAFSPTDSPVSDFFRPTVAPTNLAETIFQSSSADKTEKMLVVAIGAATLVLVALVVALILRSRRLDGRQKKKSSIDLDGGDIERDGGSSVSSEVLAGATACSSKTKKKKRNKHIPSTPPTPLTLIEEDQEEITAAESPSPASTAVMLIGDETNQRRDHHSDEEMMRTRTPPSSNRTQFIAARNLNDTFSYVVEVQTEEEDEELTHIFERRTRCRPKLQSEESDDVENDRVITPVQSFEQTTDDYDEAGNEQNSSPRPAALADDLSEASGGEPEHGLAGTANGGTHLELSVGNNQDFMPLDTASPSRFESPVYDLNDTSSHSRMSAATCDSEAISASDPISASPQIPMKEECTDFDRKVTSQMPIEEEKKDDDSRMGEALTPKSSTCNSPMSQSISPGASSMASSVYLDEDNEKSQGSPATQASVPYYSPLSISGAPPAGGQLSEDNKQVEALPQPGLVHNNSVVSQESSLKAPGSHYIMDRAFRDKFPLYQKAQAPSSEGSDSEPENSKYGQSVRRKSAKTFPSARSGYREFEGSDSDSSQDVHKDTSSKPSFRRVSRNSRKEEKKQKTDDSWSQFLQELEEAEQQFFSPAGNAKQILGRKDPTAPYDDSEPPSLRPRASKNFAA